MFRTMKPFATVLSMLGIALVFFACRRDIGLDPALQPGANCDSVTYATHIQPIIMNQCATAGCHDAGSPNGDYTTYAGVKQKVDNHTFRDRVVTQGDMPPTAPLPPHQVELIKCWLGKGAPNN